MPTPYVPVDPVSGLHPLDYPGTPAPGPGILDGDRFWLTEAIGPVDGRTLMLAVGSNATPAVLAGKLRRAGVAPRVPMIRAEVEGLAIGHSAHVSRRGYLPAAPYVPAGAQPGTALWLTPEQRAALDVTEPNYDRIRLRSRDVPLRLEHGEPPAAYEMYASRWGVLAVDGSPLPIGTQRELHARLSGVSGLAGLVPWHDPAAAVRALADSATRDRVRDRLAAAGCTVPDGLGPSR